MLKGPGDAEPEGDAPDVWVDPDAARGTEVRTDVAPSPAAKHAGGAISRFVCGTVAWQGRIRVCVTILHPFPDIAMHVVEAEPVGCARRAHRACPVIVALSKIRAVGRARFAHRVLVAP
jgi:hypothetical protein